MNRPGFVPTNHPNQVLGRQRDADQLVLLPPGERAPAVQVVTFPDVGAVAPARSGHPTKSAGNQGVDDAIDDRETPPCVYDPLHAEFDFTLDVASSHLNAKCTRHCTLEGFFIGAVCASREHGLELSWQGERVWCNPPFSVLRPWVERSWDERPELACVLLPNNRQEQPFWQNFIEPYRDRPGSILTTRFLRKRRPFLHMGEGIGNRTSKNPPFGLIVAIWDRRSPTMERSITRR